MARKICSLRFYLIFVIILEWNTDFSTDAHINSQEAMYERVAIQAIAEQQRHHEAARRLEEMQTKSLQDHRDKTKRQAHGSKQFKGKLTVRSVELV